MNIIEKAVARLSKPDRNQGMHRVMPSIHTESSPSHQNDYGKPVCQLDMEALREAGYLTSTEENNQFSEEYRLIKRPLLANAFGKGAVPVAQGNLIMVTSSVPGEGKTFTTMNLALSIALERDTTVLLIDGDIINPQLSRLLAVDNEPGLVNVLEDPTIELGDVIINTDIPKLRIMPAGNSAVHSTELLSSDEMLRIANELSERYSDRVVIFDAPPFLNTTQARVLAGYVGQIMLVVEAGTTNKNAIIDATSQLDNTKVVGLILNKCKVAKKGFYGGYLGSYGGE